MWNKWTSKWWEQVHVCWEPCYFRQTEKYTILQGINTEKTYIPFITVSLIVLEARAILLEGSVMYMRKMKLPVSFCCKFLSSNLKVNPIHATVKRSWKILLASLVLVTWSFPPRINTVLPCEFFWINKYEVKLWDVLTVHDITADLLNTPKTVSLLTSRNCPSAEKKYYVDCLTSLAIINIHKPSFK